MKLTIHLDIDVEDTATVDDLKARIVSVFGSESKQVTFLNDGKLLPDSAVSLIDAGVKPGQTLCLANLADHLGTKDQESKADTPVVTNGTKEEPKDDLENVSEQSTPVTNVSEKSTPVAQAPVTSSRPDDDTGVSGLQDSAATVPVNDVGDTSDDAASRTITVAVRSPMGTKDVQVSLGSTVKDLRQNVSWVLDLPEDDVCLILSGKVLKDEDPLAQSGLSQSKAVNVVSKSGLLTKRQGEKQEADPEGEERTHEATEQKHQTDEKASATPMELSQMAEMEQKMAALPDTPAESTDVEPKRRRKSATFIEQMLAQAERTNALVTMSGQITPQAIVSKMFEDVGLVERLIQAPNSKAAVRSLRESLIEQQPQSANMPEEILNQLTEKILIGIIEDKAAIDANEKVKFFATHAITKIQNGIQRLLEMDSDFPEIVRKLGIPELSRYTPLLAVMARSDMASQEKASKNPGVDYAKQIQQMETMGFTDKTANIKALVSSNGNVEAAVEKVLTM